MQKSARNTFGLSSFVRRTNFILCLALLLASSIPAWSAAKLATIPVGQGPGQLAVDPAAHLVYVVNQTDGTVSIIDSQLLAVKKVIKVGAGPTAIAINPLLGVAYVANTAAGSISGISGTALVGSVHIGGQPSALVVDAALNQVYVADSSRNEVLVLNATKGTVLATLPLSAKPVDIAVNIVTHSVFVVCTGSVGSIVVIDGTHNQILTTVAPLPADLASLSLDPITNVVMTSSPGQDEAITIYPANNYSILTQPSDPDAQPGATAFVEPQLFVLAMMNEGAVFFAEGNGEFFLGNYFSTEEIGATSLTENSSTNQIAVTYPKVSTVALLDEENILITGTTFLTTGNVPTGVAFDPVLSRLFVTNNADGTVSAFDVSPRSVVPAFEGNFTQNLDYNYIDTNPATGTTYTQRLGNLYAISEAKAGAGFNGQPQNSAGVTTIALGSIYSECLAVNSATNKIYVGDSIGLFYSVNGATNVPTIIQSVPSTSDIRAVAIDSGTNQIIAWDYEKQQVYVLDGSTEVLLSTIPVTSANPGFLVVDSSANLAYAVLGSVYVIDPVAGSLVATIPLPAQSFGAALNPATSRLYVITSQNVTVIDTSKNSVVTNIPFTSFNVNSVGVNPITGNFYVGAATAGLPHVFVYNGSTNALIADLSGATYPEITGSSSIAVNPLTDTIYVGTESGTSSSIAAAIDGISQAVSAVAPSFWELSANQLTVDLGSSVLAGTGYSYTSLWFPTEDLSNTNSVPITVAMQGIADSQTIATNPLFRTRNTQPTFEISATGNYPGNPAGTVPKQAFYQVDGWLGKWSSTALTIKGNAGQAKIKVPAKLSTGRHILYAYASIGDVATVQSSGDSENSPAISPISSVTFTVEK
jgi:YVTN family beta-propeller protein